MGKNNDVNGRSLPNYYAQRGPKTLATSELSWIILKTRLDFSSNLSVKEAQNYVCVCVCVCDKNIFKTTEKENIEILKTFETLFFHDNPSKV